jgi:O-antigen/teichoic acid export membrane protein
MRSLLKAPDKTESSAISSSAASSSVVKRIYGGLGFLVTGKAGAGLISIAYMVIATRLLGPTDYGILVLVHGFVTTVCGIIAFPAWQGIVRYGAHAMQENDTARLARLLRFGAMVELAAGALAILATIALAPYFGPRLGWSAEALAFLPFYAFAALGAIRSTPAAYLQLINRFDLLGLHNVVAPLVRLVGAGFVAIQGGGLLAFLVAWLVAGIAEWAALWGLGYWFARRDLGPHLRGARTRGVQQENPGIWRFLIASNGDITLNELAGRLAPLMVGWWLGPAAAGLFSVAQRATVIIGQPAQILGNSAYAELARMVASGQGGGVLRRTLIRVIGIAMLAVAPVLLLILLFSRQLVEVMAGEAFLGAAGVMILLCVARGIALAGPPCSSALSALGRPGLSIRSNLIASLLFLSLMPALLHMFGLAGAGVQAIGQSLLSTGLLIAFTWRQTHRAGAQA